jgi:hypothetical protein
MVSRRKVLPSCSLLPYFLCLVDSFVLQCIATPVPLPAPVFGLKDVSHSKANKRVSYKQAVKQHKNLMIEATTMANGLTVKKLHSLQEARNLLDHDLPLYIGKEIILPGKYNNVAYHRSVKDLEAHLPALETKHIQLMNHAEALARHKNKPEARVMAAEANKVLFSLTSVHPWLSHHVEDVEAGPRIKELENGPVQDRPLRTPRVSPDLAVKREQATVHLKSIPNIVSV